MLIFYTKNTANGSKKPFSISFIIKKKILGKVFKRFKSPPVYKLLNAIYVSMHLDNV